MARDWTETHTTDDPDILKGVAEFTRQDDKVPEASPSSKVRFIETTGRSDGPFGSGRQYVISTDTFEDFVEDPPPPPTLDETRLATLEADNAAEDANVDALLANSTWNATDRDAANRNMLRQSAIVDLRNRLGK